MDKVNTKRDSMRLLHITSSLKVGGAESLLVDLARAFQEVGYEQEVVYFYDGPNRESLEKMGIATYQVKGLVSVYDPIFITRLWQLVRRLKPDCIHTMLWTGNFFGRLIGANLGIPVICSLHNPPVPEFFKSTISLRVRNLIDRLTYRFATHTVAVSRQTAELVVQKRLIAAQAISVIHNGINEAAVTRTDIETRVSRSDLSIKETQFVIGAVGRFIPRKNFAFLIRSFAKLHARYSDACLVLIGYGPLEGELRRIVDELRITDSVRFVINQPAQRYCPLFDCFVQPSFQEGISIALLEAMCFACTCVVASETGMHEVIQHEKNGLIVSPRDQQQLTDALEQLYQKRDLAGDMGSAGLELIRKDFSFDSMIASYRSIFEQKKQATF